ncbi:M20/M25/M40 family metallo-hydrolase [Mesorhizobium sp. M0522]|uniref:M20/M25/M40 family metallo-hydrolase n=1 Tax=Mesorhizobium sp. M0522 TaxID=2956958 RepID=UPI00333CA696
MRSHRDAPPLQPSDLHGFFTHSRTSRLGARQCRAGRHHRTSLGDASERHGLSGSVPFHNTGLYAGYPGPGERNARSIAVRGDIDALPIQETRDDVPFRSQVPGVMHACGHHIHASVR